MSTIYRVSIVMLDYCVKCNSLSKGRSFDDITEEEMLRIDYLLNVRPLKCLNGCTPREAFTDLLKRYLLRLTA